MLILLALRCWLSRAGWRQALLEKDRRSRTVAVSKMDTSAETFDEYSLLSILAEITNYGL